MPTSRSIRPEAWLTALCAALSAQTVQAAAPVPQPAEWHTAAQPALAGAAQGMAEMLLDVQINRQPQPEAALILIDGAGVLYARQADLLRWRLRAPAAEPVLRHLGQADLASARAVNVLPFKPQPVGGALKQRCGDLANLRGHIPCGLLDR